MAPGRLKEAPIEEDFLELEAAAEGEEIVFDYAALGLTLRHHPLALLRDWLTRHRLRSVAELLGMPNGRLVRACGLVITRQQPETAKGVVFVTLEDETRAVQVHVFVRTSNPVRIANLIRSKLVELDTKLGVKPKPYVQRIKLQGEPT